MAGYSLSGACEDLIGAMGCDSAVRIASGLPRPWRLPVRRACIAGSRRCCWSPRGGPWPRPPAAAMSTAPACTAGWGGMAWGGMGPRPLIGRGGAGRGGAVGSRRGGWLRRWHVTRAAAATGPRAGRRRCWRTTWPRGMASPSAPGRCGAGCTRRAIAGSGRATSMPDGRRIWPRKRGSGPAPEGGLAGGRRAAVHGLDAAAAVPAAARGLGAHGSAGRGADRRRQRQAGAVRGDRPADGAPRGAGPPPRQAGRRAGVPRRAAPALPPRRADLAAGRSRERPHRPTDPGAGRQAAHPVPVAAQAGARAEPDGSALARAQTAHRGQPAGRVDRRPGRRGRRLGPDADATAGASQGCHDLEAVLAEKPVAALLATYLEAYVKQLASVGFAGSWRGRRWRVAWMPVDGCD